MYYHFNFFGRTRFMKKIITFCIPCYNSENYMRKCIESILLGGNQIEIIIVDDGSKDSTAEIADEYENKFPNVVRVIHQPNKGHGGAVNAGIAAATGLYYKVVDSDDYLEETALKKLIAKVIENHEQDKDVDLYITNYVYDHTYSNTQKVVSYESVLTANEIVSFDSLKKFKFSKVLMMHSLLYKTEVLINCGIKLPEHTFYVDNLYAYIPLPFIKSVYYLNVDLYFYFIGREDQSINIKNFVNRYDQQNRVMQIMYHTYSYKEIMKMNKNLRKYMFHDLSLININTMMFMISSKEDKKTRKDTYKKLQREFKKSDPKLYRKLRYRSYFTLISMYPWEMKRFSLLIGYKTVCKLAKVG